MSDGYSWEPDNDYDAYAAFADAMARREHEADDDVPADIYDNLDDNLIALDEAAKELTEAIQDIYAIGPNQQNLGSVVSAMELIASVADCFEQLYLTSESPDADDEPEPEID